MRIDRGSVWTTHASLTEPDPAEGKELGVKGQEKFSALVSKAHSSLTWKVLHLKAEVAEGWSTDESLPHHKADRCKKRLQLDEASHCHWRIHSATDGGDVT